MIKVVVCVYSCLVLVCVVVIFGFVMLFLFGGVSFGMVEEVIFFVLIFILLVLVLWLDLLIGVVIFFVGLQVGFVMVFFNFFNVGVVQGIVGVLMFLGFGYCVFCWVIVIGIIIVFLMWWVVCICCMLQFSLSFVLDEECCCMFDLVSFECFVGLMCCQCVVFGLFVVMLVGMIVGVVCWGWYIEEIVVFFFVMVVVVGLLVWQLVDDIVVVFLQGVCDFVGIVFVIVLVKVIVILMCDGQIIDMLFYVLVLLVGLDSLVFVVQKMFLIQLVINFFIYFGIGQVVLMMLLMVFLVDFVGVMC